jgi:hypothetical protein
MGLEAELYTESCGLIQQFCGDLVRGRWRE